MRRSHAKVWAQMAMAPDVFRVGNVNIEIRQGFGTILD